MKQKTILIPGGAGYVGSKLVEISLKNKFKVICIDKLVYGKNAIATFLNNPDFLFYEGDIRDAKDLKKIFKNKIDYVVNLASIVGDKQCKTIAKTSYDINYTGNKLLFEICKKNKVKKYLFASTCSNYGISTAKGLATEDTKLNPVSLYAETKIDCENYLLQTKDDTPTVIILRFGTAYGASFRTRFDLTLNSFTYEALKYGKIDVFAKSTWRPYIHVADIGEMMITALNYGGNIHKEIFNAGYTSENYTKEQMVRQIVKFLPNTKINYDMDDFDKRNYKVSCEKIKKKLNLNLHKNIDFGIKENKDLNLRKKITEKEIKENLLDNNCNRLLNFFKNEK